MAYRRLAHVAWRRIGGETAVVDLKTRRVFGLNEAGGVVWDALDRPRSGSELTGLLYGTASGSLPPAACEAIVDGFLAELVRCDLIEGEPGAAPGPSERAPGNVEGFRRPEIAWRDEIRAFGVSCAKQPGNGGCGSLPTA